MKEFYFGLVLFGLSVGALISMLLKNPYDTFWLFIATSAFWLSVLLLFVGWITYDDERLWREKSSKKIER